MTAIFIGCGPLATLISRVVLRTRSQLGSTTPDQITSAQPSASKPANARREKPARDWKDTNAPANRSGNAENCAQYNHSLNAYRSVVRSTCHRSCQSQKAMPMQNTAHPTAIKTNNPAAPWRFLKVKPLHPSPPQYNRRRRWVWAGSATPRLGHLPRPPH